MKKPNLKDARIAALEQENTVQMLALTDLANGGVTWFGRSPYRIGISRPTGAAGGILICNAGGTCSAHYAETFLRETLAHIAVVITGADTEANSELLRRRAALSDAQRFIHSQQAAQ